MVSFEPAARLLEGGQRRIATSRPPAGFSYLDFSSEAAAGGSVAGGSCRLLPPGIRGGLTGRSSNSRREVAARLARHGLPSRWQVKVRQLAASQPGEGTMGGRRSHLVELAATLHMASMELMLFCRQAYLLLLLLNVNTAL